MLMTLLLAAMNVFAANSLECRTNEAFIQAGWKVYAPSEFHKIATRVLKNTTLNRDQFVKDTHSQFYSTVGRQMMYLDTLDDLRTPRSVMFGDVALITSYATSELVEVRWYENGFKHLVYNDSRTACATNLIPFASNALY